MAGRLPFSQQLKRERELRSWSQADVASLIGTDPKTVNRWESGKRMPRPYLRRKLCELFGRNAEEFGLLEESSNYDEKTQLDFDNRPGPLFAEGHVSNKDYLSPTITASTQTQADEGADSSISPYGPVRRENWGEAPLIETFYGRDKELDTLRQWIVALQCRVVAILGMGGMGKTTLAAYLVQQIKLSFEYVFWRSLQNAPPLEHVLKQCIQFLSNQQSIELPKSVDDQISLLIEYLRGRRCLLVLDNAESLLQAGQRVGQYREGYESYGMLLRRAGEAQHMSCILLTSREKPREITLLDGKTKPVQSLHLSGVGFAEGQKILKDKGLFGSPEQWKSLVDRYSGNPLALKLVSEYIKELFEGNIELFLVEEELAFGDINDLLDQQFRRLSKQEQEILFWLAIEREAISPEKIRENVVRPMYKGALLEALDSLRHRSLIETRGPAQFLLQPVIMEYVANKLIKQACQELEGADLDVWTNYAFMKAQATDYVRESQRRLILYPIAEQLLSILGKGAIEQRLKAILSRLRQMLSPQQGYVAGNVLNLLIHLQSDLRCMDFSSLTIRQAYLQGVFLPDVNFANAHFVSSVFTNTFGNILSVAFGSQGRLLAIGTATGDIWVYQVMGRKLLRICSGHTDGVWSVVFSSDEQVLVSSSDDQTIRLWDVSTGYCFRILRGHTNRVRTIALSPNDAILVSGSDDETICVWDVNTGRCLRTLREHIEQEQSIDFRIWSVAFSFDGTLLASGSTDGTICLLDTQTWRCLWRLRGHTGGVRSVAFNRDGTILASGSNDQTLRLWDISTGHCFQILRGHRNRIWSVAYSPDERFLASSSEDQTVHLWDAYSYLRLRILQDHTHGVRSIAFSPDGQILASGGEDQAVRLWNPETGYCLQTLQGFTNRVWSIAFSPDGSTLVSGCEDQTIRLWDTTTGHCLYIIQGRSHGVRSIAFSPDGRTLASGGEDQTVRLWDASTSRALKALQGHTNWIWSVAFSSDGQTLASGSEDHTIRLWQIDTGQNLHTLQDHSSWVRSVTFSPDGQTLASGSDDQTIKLWETHTGRCLHTLKEHTNRVRSVAFSPDGRILASSSEDHTIRLWEVETGRCLHVLQGHTNWVRSVTFSPDGYALASGSEDRTVRLWEVKTGRCFSTFRGHANRIRSVTFSPNGQVLASGSDDGTIILWNVVTSESFNVLRNERPYEGMNISHIKGLTEAQKASLRVLGAIEPSGSVSGKSIPFQ